ncbi:DUF2891 family protein [Brevibacterium aurantiacum]|uniref:DUF2891 domain-containing protein n=1 Tax=Brevibacterium aurantiacum TaxID=273384 RepID=A0A2H1JYN3_BREAU|nr:DUF2891 family protein [Brevibacterium aurantiacum]GEB24220.1 hypothetical protein BAU01nite_29530 [Brevibacterium aurantiacum]SMX92596.1 Protein of unknown function (DUF2891) [Brevibacterium aurantiacum]
MPQPAKFVTPFAEVALSNITRDYPYAAHQVAGSPADIVEPREKNPAFANSFDWHSSVHMHYLLVSLLATPIARTAPWRDEAIDALTAHLSPAKLTAESAFLRENSTWERPYGWAWAVELVRALERSEEPRLRDLASGAEVLAGTVFDLTVAWLPNMPEPVRHGIHPNTAFGLRRILIGARDQGRQDVVDAIAGAARRCFADDHAWNFAQERSGQDFLSPGLCEVDLMAEVLAEDELAVWLPDFLAELTPESPALSPVEVPDPTDGYQSHLYGLGLSVAASIMRLSPRLLQIAERSGNLDLADRARGFFTTVDELMAPGLEAAVSDEYMASHWVATFAWEALELHNRQFAEVADRSSVPTVGR